jgi:hypothetical protein
VPEERLTTAIVSGAIANKPLNGGEAWVRLTWALGLRRLGLDVHLVEQIAPEHCVDEWWRPTTFDSSLNRDYFESVTSAFGLNGSASLICTGSRETAGVPFDELVDRAADADLLVNISGHLRIPELFEPPRRKVYVDVDPGFTQFWHAAGVSELRLEGHDHYLTVGENIGAPGCEIPTGGLRWMAVRPPVLMDEWSCADPPPSIDRFTTVATWRSRYGPVDHGAKRYSLKVHEFRKFRQLPGRVGARFEIALDIDPADRTDLEAMQVHGWKVVDPLTAVPDPVSFRSYVRGSGAEFSVAQGIYVETNSGWFSDRTAAYLASGRPALIQDTGFSRNYPVGRGLLAFRTLQEAARGVERITAEYECHCLAARQLAQARFDSDEVLGRVLADLAIS